MSLLTGDARTGTVIATGPLGMASFLDEDRLFFPRAPNGWFSPWSYQSMPATGGTETPVLPAVVNHEYPRFVLNGTKILYRAPGATMSTLTLVKADGSDPVVLGNGPGLGPGVPRRQLGGLPHAGRARRAAAPREPA